MDLSQQIRGIPACMFGPANRIRSRVANTLRTPIGDGDGPLARPGRRMPAWAVCACVRSPQS